jgi:hypothetical protein
VLTTRGHGLVEGPDRRARRSRNLSMSIAEKLAAMQIELAIGSSEEDTGKEAK